MDKGFVVVVVVGLLIGAFLIGSAIQYGLSVKHETIQGKVTDVEVFYDYFIIEFNNNSDETYRVTKTLGDISETKMIDLISNSELIVTLHYSSYWLTPNVDNQYSIQSIYKIPSEGE